MEFRIQDIFKNLMPGIILIMIVSYVWLKSNPTIYNFQTPPLIKDLSAVFLIVFLAFVYLIGFFIDSIASFIERKFLYSWFKKPSYYLLNNRSSYVIARRDDILEHLCNKKRVAAPNFVDKKLARLLFNIANELKDNNPSNVLKEKVAEYYNAYIFSRNLMISIFISLVLCSLNAFVYNNQAAKEILVLLIIILLISFFRWKSRGYYYSRQVLFAAFY